MIDFENMKGDGERWELFARDFFSGLGFTVETPPNRGPDGGMDFLVSESTRSHLSSYSVKWMVSCKNNIQSGKAVNEKDEPNILERCRGFGCERFIGFYSTIPSSGLSNRLNQLKNSGDLRDYKLFDLQKIENFIIEFGMSKLISQYFPESYKKIRPLHEIFDGIIKLKCDCCGKDLLNELVLEKEQGIVAFIEHFDEHTGITEVEDIYFACKGRCDMVLEKKTMADSKTIIPWRDISDLAKPNQYLQYLLALVNQLHNNEYKYSDVAIEKEKYLLSAMAQKVFHEVTPEEKEELRELFRSGII